MVRPGAGVSGAGLDFLCCGVGQGGFLCVYMLQTCVCQTSCCPSGFARVVVPYPLAVATTVNTCVTQRPLLVAVSLHLVFAATVQSCSLNGFRALQNLQPALAWQRLVRL